MKVIYAISKNGPWKSAYPPLLLLVGSKLGGSFFENLHKIEDVKSIIKREKNCRKKRPKTSQTLKGKENECFLSKLQIKILLTLNFYCSAIFLFFNLFIDFNWRLIILQYCSGFCHTLTWISHGCTCVSHSEPPSYLTPHPIPLGCPRAPALSALFHALNLDWSSISHMVIYTFQCYSLKSSHPRLFPHSPKNLFFTSVSLLLSCM